MPVAFQQLKEKLREMFQLDRGDLDFGIYRIMNQKRDEITHFLDHELLPQVRTILESYQPNDMVETKKELEKAIAGAEAAGFNPEESPKVQALRQKLNQTVDIEKVENEIYSDMYNFFKRYYSEGDFMSMRRYKEGVYALPYEGEEVKLHWANYDQYYIKTSENLKNYTFKTVDNKRVRFEVVAGSTEKNNNKAAEGKERRFMLAKKQVRKFTDNDGNEQQEQIIPVEIKDNELIIRFEYRSDENKRAQDVINQEVLKNLLQYSEAKSFGLLEKAPTEKNKDRTLLEKHLTEYTAKNTFDYFIHKSLGKFLRQELDFYIKNEIMHLDDIENEAVPKVESYLAKIKAMRQVAGKVIQFLAQLEDFQKKLWLKKKFVLETHYCVTLDHIIASELADELLAEITQNHAQCDEWVKLFAIDELAGYGEKLTVDFLKANDKLLVDTKFFNVEFKYKLLSIFENLDEKTDGLLINSENFQALNLLQERYNKKVKCIYIDPPFNLGENGDFLYKTNYLDSSWLSLLKDRIKISKNLLTDKGVLFNRCDYNGNYILRILLNDIFGADNYINEFGINRIFKNKNEQEIKSLPFILDTLFLYKKQSFYFVDPYKKLDAMRTSYWRHMNDSAGQGSKKEFFGVYLEPPLGKHWKYGQESINDKILSGELKLFCSNRKCDAIHYSGIATEKCHVCGSNWNPKYLVKETNFKILDTNWTDIPGYSSSTGFSTENSEKLLQRVIETTTQENDIILDYFAGSGTTQAVARKLNRKWIGVEMGEQFYTFIIPRLKNVLFGKKSMINKDINSKTGGIFKYIILEQYEDTLDNLTLNQSQEQIDVLKNNPSLKEQYLLSYMLDIESRGSQSLLNIDGFANPFAYTLRITRDDDTQIVNVDLIETFNYLIGLTVQTIKRDKHNVVTVTGINSAGENCLIIWRNTQVMNNDQMDKWFKEKHYSSRDHEFDVIYVNGDNTIENLKEAHETWKVRLIEAEFKRLMFDVQDI